MKKKTQEAVNLYRAALEAEANANAALVAEQANPRTPFSKAEAEIVAWSAIDDRRLAAWEAGQILTVDEAADGDELAKAADLETLAMEIGVVLGASGTTDELEGMQRAIWERIRAAERARLALSKRRIAAGLPQPRALPTLAHGSGLKDYRVALVVRAGETLSRQNDGRIQMAEIDINRRRAEAERQRRAEEKARSERHALPTAAERDKALRESEAAEWRDKVAANEKETADLAASSRARELDGAAQ